MMRSAIKAQKRTAKPQYADTPEAKRFIQIKTVVKMSDAWRTCNYSARSAFIELSARLQWVRDKSDPINNGRLFLSRDVWEKEGFSSATVTRALKQLIKVGLLYRTRTGGIGKDCSEYALTCYPLTRDTSGLFCKGFMKDAWANYVVPPKKTRESKENRDRFKNDSLPPENGDKEIIIKPAPAIIFKHQESESTNLQGNKARVGAIAATSEYTYIAEWIIPEIAHLASLGLTGRQCYVVRPTIAADPGEGFTLISDDNHSQLVDA